MVALPKTHKGAYVKDFSDRRRKPALAEKGDLDILEAKAIVEESIDGRANVFIEMEKRITEESNRKYPNKEYIQKCRTIQEQHRRYYEEMLSKQKGE